MATAVTVALALASACSAPDASGQEPASTTTSTTALATPSTSVRAALADQTPPRSTFGLSFRDEQLWIADFVGGQVLAVDPDSGTIVGRLRSEDGVSAEVTDVAVANDGTIYWIGLNDGAVSVMSTSGNYRNFSSVAPGTYSIGVASDGRTLFAGGAIGEPGSLWRIDLTFEKEQKPAPQKVRMRSFAVGPEGQVYGPRFGPPRATPAQPSGALLEVDASTGEARELAAGLDSPIAAELSPDKQSVYVLSLPPGGRPALAAVDRTTGAVRRLPAPRTPLVDNLAVAPDGRIFVSARNEAVVNIIQPDGQVRLLPIGQPPPT